MGSIRFRLLSLLLVMTAIAIATWIGVQWIDARNALDLTNGRPSACKVHRVRMSRAVVPLTFGMRPLLVIDEVRPNLFPHADEPYDTGWCLPPSQQNARVYVCPRCTKVRADWLRTAGNAAFAMAL